MATIKDVALMAGVSISTVSRALSGKVPVDQPTKERVLRCVEALNYHPNALAKGLKEGKTSTIAFVVPNIENLIYPTLAIAVESEARRHGYFVLICNTQEQPERQEDYIQKLKDRYVDGFIFSTAWGDDSNRSIQRLQQEGYPTVCLMRSMSDTATDTLVVDNEKGAYLGIRFLLRHGYTNIATITGRPQLLLYRQRLAGYKRGLAEAGIPVEEENIWYGVEDNMEKAYYLVKEKLRTGRRPQVIFAQSDPLAFDAIRAARSMGLRVPEDISVMGFDNVSLAEQYSPSLTTVKQPLYEMGRAATQHLIGMIEDKATMGQAQRMFTPEVIVRKSVKLVKE